MDTEKKRVVEMTFILKMCLVQNLSEFISVNGTISKCTTSRLRFYHYQPHNNGNVFSTTFYSETHTFFLFFFFFFAVSFIFQSSKLKLPAAEQKVVKHLLISCLLILRYTVCRQPDSIDINHIIYICVLCLCCLCAVQMFVWFMFAATKSNRTPDCLRLLSSR